MPRSKMRLRRDWQDHDAPEPLTERDRRIARELEEGDRRMDEAKDRAAEKHSERSERDQAKN